MSKSITTALWGGGDPLSRCAVKIVGELARISYNSSSHSCLPVRTAAIGAGAEKFLGFYDNTEIAKKIRTVLE